VADALTRSRIVYFEREGGRANLQAVVQAISRKMAKRVDLRTVIFFTARGEGPLLAYQSFQQIEPEPRIISVSFPQSFVVRAGGQWVHPEIPAGLKRFFTGVGISVLEGRLPWDPIHGAEAHNRDMDLIKRAIAIFGGSFPLCIQACLQACDSGLIAPQQRVIAATGDCAAILTATSTHLAFSKGAGLAVNEIICKPRNPTLLYEWAKEDDSSQQVLKLSAPDKPIRRRE
jgi:hypothetical protein